MLKLRGLPKDSSANDPRNCWMVRFICPLPTPPPSEPGNKNKVFSGFQLGKRTLGNARHTEVNRPFLSRLLSRFQSESWCKTLFHDFDLYENKLRDKTLFHNNCFAGGPVLIQRQRKLGNDLFSWHRNGDGNLSKLK